VAKVRTIGVSNWTRKQLKETLASCRVPPQVLQVELHPLLPQAELRADCAAAGIRVMTPTRTLVLTQTRSLTRSPTRSLTRSLTLRRSLSLSLSLTHTLTLTLTRSLTLSLTLTLP
jgi:hypothetical protein